MWDKYEVPVFFRDIRSVDSDLIPVLKKLFPFFQDTYSKTLKKNVWVNTCIHCQTIQGDDYNFRNNGPFYSFNGSGLKDKKTELIQLRFDYYLDAVIDEGEYAYIGPTYQS